MRERRAWSREGERGGYHRLHRGQPRRFSPSPDARNYGGDWGPSRVPLYGGARGEVSGARLRRRKASEQVDGQRDRFLDDQRRGVTWEEQQRRRSRVRVRYGSELSYRMTEDDQEGFESEVSRDG